MSVTIDQPEIEALIEQRLATGDFPDVEAVLLYALKAMPTASNQKQPKQNLADFLMDSPLRGSGVVIERIKDYPVPAEM